MFPVEFAYLSTGCHQPSSLPTLPASLPPTPFASSSAWVLRSSPWQHGQPQIRVLCLQGVLESARMSRQLLQSQDQPSVRAGSSGASSTPAQPVRIGYFEQPAPALWCKHQRYLEKVTGENVNWVPVCPLVLVTAAAAVAGPAAAAIEMHGRSLVEPLAWHCLRKANWTCHSWAPPRS